MEATARVVGGGECGSERKGKERHNIVRRGQGVGFLISCCFGTLVARSVGAVLKGMGPETLRSR